MTIPRVPDPLNLINPQKRRLPEAVWPALTPAVPTLKTVWDAVAINTIPAAAQGPFLGYVDVYDFFGTPIIELLRARWPHATIVPITTTGLHTYKGERVRLCDSEFKDLSSQGAARWAYDDIQAGSPAWDPPAAYLQAANGGAFQQACSDIGLELGAFGAKGTQVCWYEAWWNGQPNLLAPPPPWPQLPEPVGHQYVSYFDAYDVSVALSSWLYPQPPEPKISEEAVFIRNPTKRTINGAVVEAGEIDMVSGGKRYNIGATGPGWQDVVNSAAAQSLPTPLLIEDTSGVWFDTFPAT